MMSGLWKAKKGPLKKSVIDMITIFNHEWWNTTLFSLLAYLESFKVRLFCPILDYSTNKKLKLLSKNNLTSNINRTISKPIL